MNSQKQRRIEERAYALWEAEGQLHGRHEEHWHRAAREIEAEETARPTVSARPRGPPGGAPRILAATRDNARKSRRHRAEATIRVSRRGSDVPISLSTDPQRL
jgi:hypothetical protein